MYAEVGWKEMHSTNVPGACCVNLISRNAILISYEQSRITPLETRLSYFIITGAMIAQLCETLDKLLFRIATANRTDGWGRIINRTAEWGAIDVSITALAVSSEDRKIMWNRRKNSVYVSAY